MADYVAERAMYPLLRLHLRDRGFFVLSQAKVGVKVADFLAFRIDWDVVRDRLSYCCTRTAEGQTEWRILSALREAHVHSASEIAAYLNLSLSYTTAVLRRLRQKGFIVSRADGNLLLRYWPRYVFSDALVVEAKLSDWRHALSQAMRYRGVTNARYIALPYDFASRNFDRMYPELVRWGVGLLGVNSTVDELLPPKRTPTDARCQLSSCQLSERVFMALLRYMPTVSKHHGYVLPDWVPFIPETCACDDMAESL